SYFFFQAEDGIRYFHVTGVQTCALPIFVKSLVSDVIMPPIGLALGGVDFSDLFVTLKDGANAAGPYATLVDAQTAGAVTINYGMFLNNATRFVIVAFAVFMLVKTIKNRKHQA